MKLSEDQVKEMLHINNFRELRKDQIMEFVSSIPNMDKETAIHCIEQFPNFKEYSSVMVEQLTGLYKEALAQNHEATKLGVAGYALVLDDLHRLLDKDVISPDERMYIMDKEVEVADKLAEFLNRNRHFLADVLTKAGAVVAGGLAIGATILGSNILKKR